MAMATPARSSGRRTRSLMTLTFAGMLGLLVPTLVAPPAHADTNYTQGITPTGTNQVQAWFTPAASIASSTTLVDIHYLLNSGGEQDFRMTKNGSTWQQAINNVTAGSTLQYWFTYGSSQTVTDTPHFTYTQGSGGGTGGGGTGGGGTSSGSTFPMAFTNNTGGRYTNDQIYLTIIGQGPDGKFTYLKPDGTQVDMNPADASAPGHLTKNGVNYPNMSFTLAQAASVTIPAVMDGGRAYISLGSPLYIQPDASGDGQYAGPDPNNASDPNQGFYWDYYEFAWDPKGVNTQGNPATYGGDVDQVDGFAIPITARVQQAASKTDETRGITASHSQVVSQYQSFVGSAFQGLVGNYRITAPSKSPIFQQSGGAQANYLQSVIDQTWNYYTNHTLTFSDGSNAYSGHVVGSQLQFSVNQAGSYVINKPTSGQVMACDGPMASGGTEEHALEAQLCAAFNRGVATDTSKWWTPSAYYPASTPHNDYAAFWHTINQGNVAYGFPYDDNGSQSSVVILPNTAPPDKVTLNINF
ncbi:glycoside hydrolase family 64 protein [Streptomyces puniciscabiei]